MVRYTFTLELMLCTYEKEKRLNNCYQQLIRRISSDVVYILKWLEYYATIRGENQDTKRRTRMIFGS